MGTILTGIVVAIAIAIGAVEARLLVWRSRAR